MKDEISFEMVAAYAGGLMKALVLHENNTILGIKYIMSRINTMSNNLVASKNKL